MVPIENQEVIALLAVAEAFSRAGDTRAALDRAKRARRDAKASTDGSPRPDHRSNFYD